MTKKAIIVVAVLALVALAVPVAYAASTNGNGAVAGAMGRWFGRGACVGLDLTSDQLDQMQALRDQFQAEVGDLLTQRDTIQSEVRDLRQSGADQAQIDAKIAELDQVREAIQEQAQTHQDEISSILTPEQQSQLGDAPCGGLGLGQGFGPGGGQGLGGQGFGGRGRGMGGGCRGFGGGN